MTLTARIEINPRVMLYPSLKREDIQAAMRYAADTLAHEEVVFIGTGSAERRD